MKFLRRLLADFKANPKGYWFAVLAIGFTLFFFIDLAAYYALGDDYTLSAAFGDAIGASQNSIWSHLAFFLAGVWLSHLCGFFPKPRRDSE